MKRFSTWKGSISTLFLAYFFIYATSPIVFNCDSLSSNSVISSPLNNESPRSLYLLRVFKASLGGSDAISSSESSEHIVLLRKKRAVLRGFALEENLMKPIQTGSLKTPIEDKDFIKRDLNPISAVAIKGFSRSYTGLSPPSAIS